MTGIELVRMSDPEYFAHPAINHSTLRWFVERTPAHARHYMTQPPTEPTTDMELGTAVHSLVLGGPQIVCVNADSWRTKAAQTERAEARTSGAIALLEADYTRAEAMAAAVIAPHTLAGKLHAHADHLETVIIWEQNGTECKAKLDGVTGRLVWDLKTTYNADPESFGRSAAKYGYHTQAAWYLDAARAAGIEDPKFLFIVVEKDPPHLVNVIELDPYDVELGARRNARALAIYAECVASDTWPGYGDGINTAQLPRWAEIAEETAA